MNNNQFRKLVLDTPARKAAEESTPSQAARNGATPSLGSRMRSSIPMTPRTVAGYSHTSDFARQLAERNSGSQPTKKFRSSAAPKGAKLADGYVDRAKQRLGEPEEDDKVKRVKALEEMMKLQQIDEATFIKLRDEILGDEVGVQRAGLVKGLDWKMLERVRRGEVSAEDVLEGGKGKSAAEEEGLAEDVDDEFDELEGRDVEAVTKEQVKKKGEMAPPELTGKKRNRDQILADLKAARQAAKDAAAPALGSRFKKVGDRRSESRIERDSKGREVLITIDEDGNEKRKVRKIQPQEPVHEKGHGLLMPDKDVKPLGMEVPALPEVVEDDDINIFDDAGDDYDPLAGLGDDSDDSAEEGEEGEVSESKVAKAIESPAPAAPGAMLPPPRPPQKQNYFGTSTSSTSETPSPNQPAGLSDPVLLAALKKASTISSALTSSSDSSASAAEDKAKAEKHKRMLQQDNRDADDMDMGFGSSRFADEEDSEEKKVKLSEWGSKDGEEEGERGKKARGRKGGDKNGEGGDRKRGPKKRKGDVNSAADVLKVIAQRKAGGS